MTVGQLIALLKQADPHLLLPVTIISDNGDELPLRDDGPIVTLEGGGASPAFVAINIALPQHLREDHEPQPM